MTEKECKKILFNIGIELGVSPRLIATRLLDDRDKADMMAGYLTIDALRTAVEVWRDNGMIDYAHGKIEQ